MLAQIDFLDASLAQVRAEIDRHLGSVAECAEAVALAQTLPGVAETAATGVIAEIGPDMRVFPSHRHLASWARVRPGNKQSAGRRLSGQTRPGNPRLKALLCAVAQAIGRTSGNDLAALYHRLVRRRGKGRAALAVAHSVLVILYQLLREHKPYPDLGADDFDFDKLDAERLQRQHVRRLEQLGSSVTLMPVPAA